MLLVGLSYLRLLNFAFKDSVAETVATCYKILTVNENDSFSTLLSHLKKQMLSLQQCFDFFLCLAVGVDSGLSLLLLVHLRITVRADGPHYSGQPSKICRLAAPALLVTNVAAVVLN